MLPGVAGHLIAEAALEQRIESSDPAIAAAHRVLRTWRTQCASLGPASSLRTMAEVGAAPLTQVLGYSPSTAVRATDVVILDLSTGGSLVPCVVCPWAAGLETHRREAALAGRARASRWALLFNGTHVRILDASSAHSRRYLEVDLDLAADEIRTFAALWMAARSDMLTTAGTSAVTPLAGLVAESDAFAAGVCRSLRDGVLAASSEVLAALAAPRQGPDTHAAFEQSLTVVYRILFLLFAESRGLVPMWHPIYRASYSIDALRAAAERGRVAGLWDALRAVSRLAHAGCRAGDLTVTPFNGRLFDAARAPFVERHDLDDDAAQRAVLALTTRRSRERGGRERIAYRDLGVEQLGAVYETLLDYQPGRQESATPSSGRGPRRRPAIALIRGSAARKATGSFYTPQPIARFIVRQTLGPLVRGRTADEVLSLRVLDPSMGSGAFLVAACAFLAEAYEEALIAAGACLPGDLGGPERAAIRRLIAERCLFGVDLNPMAVQLARLSLWLATLARDRPLSFLDHHLRTGDSLLGAWLWCLARRPVPRRGGRKSATPSLFGEDRFESAARLVVPVRFALAGPNDTLDQVKAKERALARLERSDSVLTRWRRVADLWCAQWFTGSGSPPASAYGALVDAVLSGRGDLPHHVARRYLEPAAEIARTRRFFHWELEFPEVFFDAGGQRRPAAGFDAVIGNPPWDMVRADSGSAADRDRSREDAAGLLRFARDAGVYDAESKGHANRYQLFLERSVALLRDGGRCGLVLPGGLATDQGSAAVRRLLFTGCAVDGLVGFENRRAVFPIHRSVRFLLLTATRGTATAEFGVRLGEEDPAILEQPESGARDWFPVRLSPDLLRHLSGSDLAVPDLRQPVDVAIAERAAALFPPLGTADGWHVEFGRELNATDDREVLVQAGRGLPVIEGKLLAPFEVHPEGATRAIRAADAARLLGPRHLRPRLGYRDVASSTNRLTLIAAILPRECASTHTVFCLKTALPLQAQHFLCGLFNSLVVNYLVRLRVTTHVTTAIVERLPVPRRDDAPGAFRDIAAMAHRLARGARSVERMEILARLNARVAGLYQLSHHEFAHLLSTFPLIPREERDRALMLFAR